MSRGPNYPYVALEDAISLARKVYEYAKRGPAQVEQLITEAFKYSATSSSGQKVLAALKSYGLVEDAAGANSKAVKLTQRAIRLLFDDPESPERKEEIKAAALSPKWYEYCWKKWGADMPPAMKHHLVVEQGFVDSTVDGFLRDYRATIAFSGLLDDKPGTSSAGTKDESKDSLKVGNFVQWESQGVLKMPAPRKLIRLSDDGKWAFVEGYLTGIPADEVVPADATELPPFGSAAFQPHTPPAPIIPLGANKMLTASLNLENGIALQLQWPNAMSKDEFDDFVYQLEGFKTKIARTIQAQESRERESE